MSRERLIFVFMQPIHFTPVNQFSQGDVNNAQNAYNQQVGSVQQAQQNLQNYQKTMQNPSDMYQQNLSSAENQFGFNPQELKNANMALANTQTQIANLPQAIAQQGGGYGVTAGQMANNYANTSNNLQGVLAGQGNAVNALQNVYQNALQQGGQQTQFGVTGQQMQLSSLQNLFSNAANQRDAALNQLQNLQSLYQSQGQFNAKELADYQQANAAMQKANADMQLASAQAAQIRQQMQMQQNQVAAATPGTPQYQAAQQAQKLKDIQSYLNTPTGQGTAAIPEASWLSAGLGNLGNAIDQTGSGIANAFHSVLNTLHNYPQTGRL